MVRFTDGDAADRAWGDALGNFITANTARAVFAPTPEEGYPQFIYRFMGGAGWRSFDHADSVKYDFSDSRVPRQPQGGRVLDMTPIVEDGRTIYVHQG